MKRENLISARYTQHDWEVCGLRSNVSFLSSTTSVSRAYQEWITRIGRSFIQHGEEVGHWIFKHGGKTLKDESYPGRDEEVKVNTYFFQILFHVNTINIQNSNYFTCNKGQTTVHYMFFFLLFTCDWLWGSIVVIFTKYTSVPLGWASSLIQWNNMVTGQKHSFFVSANFKRFVPYCRPALQIRTRDDPLWRGFILQLF